MTYQLFGFEEQLMDEYFRSRRQIPIESAHIQEVSQGWTVNVKQKNGHSYYYREKRMNGKVISEYVKKKDVPDLLDKQKEAEQWKQNIDRQKEFIKRVERYFGKQVIDEYEPYYTQK